MVLELQGHSRKYMFKNEEDCKGPKIFFVQKYEKLCSVIFLTAWCGIIISHCCKDYHKWFKTIKIYIIIGLLWVGIWLFSLSCYQKTMVIYLKYFNIACFDRDCLYQPTSENNCYGLKINKIILLRPVLIVFVYVSLLSLLCILLFLGPFDNCYGL